MNLILNNDDGRAYISDFTVSKIVYDFICDKYSDINIITIKTKLNTITIKINANSNLDINVLENVQKDTTMLLKENLGLYVENFDIVLG